MREIKFRAWLKKENRMIEPVTGLDLSPPYATVQWFDNVHDALENKVSDCWLEDCELMQYTGLKDKNGKEIYEGDIVSWRGESDTFVIEWVDLDASFAAADKSTGKTHYDYIMTSLGDAEILGNIYENPELLEVTT